MPLKPFNQYCQGRDLRRSFFHITINTNRNLENIDDQLLLIKRFKKSILDVFVDENNQTKLLKITDENDKNVDDNLNKFIKNIYFRGGLEISDGKKNGERLHAHMLYIIEHYSKIQLDRTFIKDYISTYIKSDTYIMFQAMGKLDNYSVKKIIAYGKKDINKFKYDINPLLVASMLDDAELQDLPELDEHFKDTYNKNNNKHEVENPIEPNKKVDNNIINDLDELDEDELDDLFNNEE